MPHEMGWRQLSAMIFDRVEINDSLWTSQLLCLPFSIAISLFFFSIAQIRKEYRVTV